MPLLSASPLSRKVMANKIGYEKPVTQLALLLFEKGVGNFPPYTFADQLLRCRSKEDLISRLEMEPSLDNLDILLILKKVKELKK